MKRKFIAMYCSS